MSEASEIESFIAHVRVSYGHAWHAPAIHEPARGWLLEWRVGARELVVSPAGARKLVRRLERHFKETHRGLNRKQRAAKPITESLAWCEEFDKKARWALHANRNGITPEGVN